MYLGTVGSWKVKYNSKVMRYWSTRSRVVRDCHGLTQSRRLLQDNLGHPNKSQRLAPLESQSRQSSWDCVGHPNKSLRLDPIESQSRQSSWDCVGHPNKSQRLDPLESQSQQALGLLGTSQQVPEARPDRIPVPTVPRSAGTTWDIPTSP